MSLVVDVARADSSYPSAAIACSPSGKDDATVALDVQTGAVSIGLGSVSDAVLEDVGESIDLEEDLDPLPLLDGSLSIDLGLFSLLSLDLGAITEVSAHANLLGGATNPPLSFSGPFPTPYQRFNGGISNTALTDGLFGSLELDGSAGGTTLLGVTDVVVEGVISTALQPVLAALQPQIVDPLLSALGVTVAGADARIRDVRCQVPALANRG